MKDWIIKHKKQLCIIGSIVLVVAIICVIVFGIKGCNKVKEEPYKAPSVAEGESKQSSKDSETSEQPSQETSEQSEGSSSGGTASSPSSQKSQAQTPSQKPSSQTKQPATQQPSSGKTYHTAWGTRPHEFEEDFSWEVIVPFKTGLFGWYHVDHYGNCWHDWQEHSNGHGKMIFYDPGIFGHALYCGNGHWINDGMFGYYWGEYDYPITAHTGQIPFDPSNATVAEHPSDMLVAGGAEIGSYYAQYGDVIGKIYELLYSYPSCQTVEELVSHSQPTYNVDGSMYTKALDVKTVNAYGLYEMTSYDKWEPKSKYIAP